VQEDSVQQGSVIKSERKYGPSVWQFRWSETGAHGQRVYRKRVVGTVEEYPNSEAVRVAFKGLIAKPNPAVQLMKPLEMTIGELCQHFRQRELARDDNWRSYSTRKNYSFLLRRWIIPRWGDLGLGEVRTIEVETWLRSLPRARSTCAKIRNLMSVLFNHAWRHELFDRNPIKLVRQSAKRRTAPSVLTPAEIKLLLDNLKSRERTLVLLAASTGLRQSELFALKWGDIDFSQGTMNVTRSIAYGVVGRCKTEASQKPVPVHPSLAEALTQWRDRCRYREPNDWVFANEHHRGRHPYWGQAILRTIVRPVAKQMGIKKWIGWHTFQHTYSTLLRSVGTEFKVMQELMRHSSLRSTIDIYTQAVTPAKRAAQAAVLSLILPAKPRNKVRSRGRKCPNALTAA
jgi:integrase